MTTDWKSSSHAAAKQEASKQAVQERIREADREASERRCRCADPIPGRVYLGWTQCARCQRLMEPKRGAP